MSENKRRMNPWVATVILGVIAILFSVYAVQSQSELEDARKENLQLKTQVEACVRTAKEQQQNAAQAMQLAAAEVERANQEAEACVKSNRKK